MYTYSNMAYVDADELQQHTILVDNDDLYLSYNPSDMHLRWGVESLDDLYEGLKMLPSLTFIMPEVPSEALATLKACGWQHHAAYQDYFLRDLPDGCACDKIKRSAIKDLHLVHELSERIEQAGASFEGLELDALEEWLRDGNEILLYQDDSLKGFLLVSVYGDTPTLWIRLLVVDPSHRRKGIGRALMQEAFRWAQKKGAIKSFLACDQDNRNALSLYERLGYQKSAEAPEYVLKKAIT